MIVVTDLQLITDLFLTRNLLIKQGYIEEDNIYVDTLRKVDC